jgi:hypothetical protein
MAQKQDLKEFYTQSLTQIKPFLPYNYVVELDKSLKNISKEQIRNAFRGRLADQKKLSRIFTKAHFIARRRIIEGQDLEKQIQELSKLAEIVKAIFLPLLVNFCVYNL